MIYILFFSFSSFMVYLASIVEKYNKYLFIFIIFCSLISLTILNGIRDFNIGTDVKVYGNAIFYLATNSTSFKQFMASTDIEIGYKLLNYIVSLFTSSVHVFYFILGLITNFTYMRAILLFKNDIPITISWIIYLFLFYGNTLNIMRQGLAIGLVFLGICYLLKKNKYIISIIYLFLSISFHNSGFVGIILFLIAIYLMKIKNLKKGLNKIILFSFISSFFTQTVFLFLNNLGVLGEKFNQYTTYNSRPSEIGFSSYVLKSPFLIYSVMYYNRIISKNYVHGFLFICIFFDFIFVSLRSIDITTNRITLYFAVFKVIMFPLLIEQNSKRGNRICLYIFTLIYVFLMWYFQIVARGDGEIYPFKSFM